MWSTIENLKENLNKIAQDVHDDEEDEIYASLNGGDATTPFSDRRNSHGSARSRSASRSPLLNGFDSANSPQIQQYKSEIKRLQDSEAEIKALSINYAALLKEKEDQISRLNKENGSLKLNLDATKKGGGDSSPNRPHKSTTPQAKNRYFGNQIQNGVLSGPDGMSNGVSYHVQSDAIQSKRESNYSNSHGKEKEFADSIEDNNRSSVGAQVTDGISELRFELERERKHFANIQLKLEGEQKVNESLKEELKLLKMEKDKISTEMTKMHEELSLKISTVNQLQVKRGRREDEGLNGIVQNLKQSITTLEKENASLKMEKNKLKAAIEASRISAEKKSVVGVQTQTNHSNNFNEVESSASFLGKEEMELSLQKLDTEIKETKRERDKAKQELARLKQHLLEKESEESEKMDEDSKIIEDLRGISERQREKIAHLERALKQAISSHEEVKTSGNIEVQKYKEVIDDLKKKLSHCTSTIDAKNVELLNLQTALGQYYAEIEAKEHLEGDLARAREESFKLSQLLKNADYQADLSKKENEEILSKLLQAERVSADWKGRVNKVEEDNAKLRRALEQSMSRLNRMSLDSDYLVDRRIVIKLLVTYFQRNHNKEVLDLMVRMLGFSEEDKQRIGGAQTGAGKGVVRGVLGLPGRFVGGILGGSSSQASASETLDNQSFADLWVDFLLKERELTDAASGKGKDKDKDKDEVSRTSMSPSSYQGTVQSEHSDTEFSTVPLTSYDSSFHSSRVVQKY